MASAFGSCRPTSGWPSSSALCCTQRGAAVRRSPMLMLSRSARRAMPPWWCPPTQTTSPRSRPAYPAYGSSSDGRPMSERCADSDTAGAEDAKPAPASTVRLHRRHHRAPLHEGRFPRTLDEPQRDRPKQLRWKHQSEGSGYGRRRRPVTSSARGWEVPGGSQTLDGDVLRAPYVRSGRGEGDVHDRLQRTAGRGSGRRLDCRCVRGRRQLPLGQVEAGRPSAVRIVAGCRHLPQHHLHFRRPAGAGCRLGARRSPDGARPECASGGRDRPRHERGRRRPRARLCRAPRPLRLRRHQGQGLRRPLPRLGPGRVRGTSLILSPRHSGWPWPVGTGRVWTYALRVGMAVDLRRDDWTLADLARLPEDGYRYEIIDGELVVSPPPTNFHQRVATEMIRRWQPAAGVLTHASGVSVPTGRHRERFLVPDVLVVRNGVSSPYYVPSDVLVAVEIVSPSSVTRDRWAQRGLYAELGIPEYWLVDPGERTLTVFFQPSEEPPRQYLDHLVYAEEQMVAGPGCCGGELFET